MRMRESDAELHADPSRVVVRLFLPGEESGEARPRAAEIVDRVLLTPDDELADAASGIIADFGPRADGLTARLLDHADTVAFHIDPPRELDRDRRIVLGAAFTAEYAVEGAALCNPSAVPHPDQSGLQAGQLRVAVALRAIGEGHISSIGFATAVIGPGPSWAFGKRVSPLIDADVRQGRWERAHLQRALQREDRLGELSNSVLHALPERFDATELEQAIRTLSPELAQRHDARRDIEGIRATVASAYTASFAPDSELSQRILQPTAAEEAKGMEDARFSLVVNDDGEHEYRATYTAYDGQRIAPRLIVSPDLRRFAVHRLSGSAARNKGMALFPRRVGGELLALTRTDGENISLAHSADGHDWGDETAVHRPRQLWEVVQTGNCGAPIETEAGWLVLTHGVGPMRRYSVGAMLLDLEYPERVVAALERPMVEPGGDARDGYVPNVIYSCGGLLHEGVLWLPYGVGDNRIRVASVPVDELLDAMTPFAALGAGARGDARLPL